MMPINEGKVHFILIAGKMKSGKTTFGNTLKGVHENCLVIHFADCMKKEYAALNNVDANLLFTSREFKETHRAGMVDFAETRKKERGNHFWAKKLLETSESVKYSVIIVPDFRFQEEFDFLRNENCDITTILVESNQSSPLGVGNPRDIAYTNEFTSFDHIVKNNGSVNDLRMVAQFIKNLTC